MNLSRSGINYFPFTVTRLIADSAPHINTIVIMGCLLLLITCYLLGVDSNNPPLASPDSKQRYAIICMVRTCLVSGYICCPFYPTIIFLIANSKLSFNHTLPDIISLCYVLCLASTVVSHNWIYFGIWLLIWENLASPQSLCRL